MTKKNPALKSLDPREAARVFRGVNFMTPHIVGAFQSPSGDYYVELSLGRGPFEIPLWGVTVRRPDGSDPGLSQAFGSRAEAEDYMRSL